MQTITNLLDFGMNVREAVEAPRWISVPGTDPETLDEPFGLIVEDRFDPDVLAELERRGHRVRRAGPWSSPGALQLIIFGADGTLQGASDPRGGGAALAY